MELTQNNLQAQQYFRLMRLRRDFVLSVLVIPTVFIIVLLLVRAEEKYLSIYLPISMIPIILFTMFRLLANDICPWCKFGFFRSNIGTYGNGIDLIFRKNCSHCGMPYKSTKDENM
ncbi:hypothetical protein WAH94_17345 [Acinetobacter baumannii]|nr:hypothetical protein [Acinetobacter baumannii]MCT9480276.1 hypothetical protein [Acinetobacter baumannii]MCZ3044099.1 hypothetical protein [Acinetobacter baumannii]